MLKTILAKVASANGQDKWKVLTGLMPESVGEIYIDVCEKSRGLHESIVDKYISCKKYVRPEKPLTDKIVDSLAVCDNLPIDFTVFPSGSRKVGVMLAEGYTIGEIAESIGESPMTISRKIDSLREFLRGKL